MQAKVVSIHSIHRLGQVTKNKIDTHFKIHMYA